MKKKITVGTALILVLFAVLLTFQITYSFVGKEYQAKVESLSDEHLDFSLLVLADQLIRDNFYQSIDEDVLEEGLIKGYLASLDDPYSRYMSAEEYSIYKTEKAATGNGVGIRLTRDDRTQSVFIYSVYPESPAEKAGLVSGDELYMIGDQRVKEMNLYDVAAALSGEAGTKVTVTVKREMAAQILNMDFTMTREEVQNCDVSYEMLSDTVGYVQIFAMTDNTPEQLSSALDALDKKGVGNLIFDVRNNLGDDLDASLKMLDMLLPKCSTARVIGKSGSETVVESDDKGTFLPMAVLVNSSTVSAAELFAASLRDCAGAVLVGETTYGKAVDQTVFELDNGSAVLLSHRSFQPFVSESFQDVGVTPDHEVAFDAKKIYLVSHENDPQLTKALAILSE